MGWLTKLREEKTHGSGRDACSETWAVIRDRLDVGRDVKGRSGDGNGHRDRGQDEGREEGRAKTRNEVAR